jgi:CRP/FNR family transcriptional regulator, cyclic AMP receptor protein
MPATQLLSSSCLTLLKASSKSHFYRKNQTIFMQGQRGDRIFYIETGTVKLTSTSKQGREAMVAVLDGGSFIGEASLEAERRPSLYRATALTDVVVRVSDRKSLQKLLHTSSEFCDAFILFLLSLVATGREDLSDKLLYSSEKRLALALVSIARLSGTAQSQRLPRISQQELASMVGLTRQRVNFLMTRFKRLGYIDYANGIRVNSSIRNLATRD